MAIGNCDDGWFNLESSLYHNQSNDGSWTIEPQGQGGLRQGEFTDFEISHTPATPDGYKYTLNIPVHDLPDTFSALESLSDQPVKLQGRQWINIDQDVLDYRTETTSFKETMTDFSVAPISAAVIDSLETSLGDAQTEIDELKA